MAHPESEMQRKFLVFSYFVPYFLSSLSCLPHCLFQQLVSPQIAPTNTQIQLGTFPPLSVSNGFSFATSSIISPSDTSVSAGGSETIAPFFNTTRKGRREVHDVPVLTFPGHDLLARALEEALSSPCYRTRVREWTQSAQVHKASNWEMRAQVFLTTKVMLLHHVTLSSMTHRVALKIYQRARTNFLDQDPILYNQFYISPQLPFRLS